MGQVYHVLAQADCHPERWPYHGRLVVEDCETVHVHVNNIRVEFQRDQFLEFVEVMNHAAKVLRHVMTAQVASDGQ